MYVSLEYNHIKWFFKHLKRLLDTCYFILMLPIPFLNHIGGVIVSVLQEEHTNNYTTDVTDDLPHSRGAH
jgi:hypothetical protein